ncbi:NCS1 family nucleobase:cation symporter-1 [Caldalkalibacillus uzonensis]|uniref:NCS1 family nucleobase:cation symporter-1 n=1 Tax=Caldalkalibacillus uzonensis TaxID=353224 RepID=A0ABU0CP83_9BACI|nr:NCS1 family transporter [Caldalkalibacillus uzonensis]MDQ0338230.1 NCS1 family nucleobase:cation symporter-1 [Caldalkalibacillus uzonensis]
MKHKDYHLRSPDLLPIGSKERKISTLGFSFMWVGMAVVLAAFAIGGEGVGSIPLGWVILATLIGSVAIGLFITITGDIGIEHGLSFPVYMRAPFGTIGTHIPSVLRGVTASFWFGINTFFGSAAINGILNIMFGFDNWFLCYIIFAIIQVINTSIGIKAIERFADLAAPTIILIAIWMYISLSGQAAAAGRDVWAWVELPATGWTAFTIFMVIVFGNMGYWATLAADIPSISRYIKAPKHERNWFKRNKGTLVGSVVAMPLTQTFMVTIGAVAFIAVGNYDPIVALQQTSSGLVLAILLLMIALAQWSTNTAANLVPAATIFSNVGGPKVPFYVGVIIAGLIGSFAQPWTLFEILIPFLLVVGGILSAIVGVLFSDYYLLRKRRINLPDLYRHDGQYRYDKGINIAGFLSWIIGGLAAIALSTFSFLVGFIVGGAVYYVLAKYWYFKKHKQAEIEDPSDEKYLGITVGRDWQIEEEGMDSTPFVEKKSSLEYS